MGHPISKMKLEELKAAIARPTPSERYSRSLKCNGKVFTLAIASLSHLYRLLIHLWFECLAVGHHFR